MLGKGIYFANLLSKSLQYCGNDVTDNDGSRIAYLVLCEVAVEKTPFVTLSWDTEVKAKVDQQKKETLCAFGKVGPCKETWERTEEGVLIPMGRPQMRQQDDALFMAANPAYVKEEECYQRLLAQLLQEQGGGGGNLKGKGKKKKKNKKHSKVTEEDEKNLRQKAQLLSNRSRTPSLNVDEVVVYDESLVCIRYLLRVKIPAR